MACQKYPPINDLEKLPVLKIRELSNGISETADWATSQVKPGYIVEAGDVIFAWSASLMVKVWDGEKCVLNQHLFKVTSDEFPKWFYLRWCKHHLAEFIAVAATRDFLIDSTLVVAVFLIRAFEERKVDVVPPAVGAGATDVPPEYDDQEDFNNFWDESFGEFTMGEYSYPASEILFTVDLQAYQAEYKDFIASEQLPAEAADLQREQP